MQITLQWLEEKNACAKARLAFKHEYPEGAEYQDVLNALAADNKISWAYWLIQNAGPTQEVLLVDELSVDTSFFFAGRIAVNGDIKAGRDIEAGRDFGIYAGFRASISQKSKYAIVRAKEKPKNLLLGTFLERL